MKRILISIHPRHADAILSGKKTVELRKRVPKLLDGDRVYLYVTVPRQELAGWFTVSKVLAGSPSWLWTRVSKACCIERFDYEGYFRNAETGHGIIVKKVEKYNSPMPLGDLKKKWPKFIPPQSFLYIPDTVLS